MKVTFSYELEADRLDGDTRGDLAIEIAKITGEDIQDVFVGLSNGTLVPIVEVSPEEVIKSSSPRGTSTVAVRIYRKLWKTKGTVFPPVLINTDNKNDVLKEGGHRVLSAYKAGIKQIRAIDIAGCHVAENSDGLEIYRFKRSNR